MDGNSGCQSAARERGITDCDHLCLVPPGCQPAQKQERLALASAPIQTEVNVEGPQERLASVLGSSEPPRTSTPSLRYLR